MIGELRFCPRCDQETVWSNVADGGYVFSCTLAFDAQEQTVQGCGLRSSEDVTDVEYARLVAWEKGSSRPRVVRRYEFV